MFRPIYNCGFSNITLDITEKMHYISIGILLPVYISLGIFSSIVLLIAFAMQAKQEQNYAYQLVVVASRAIENVSFGFYLVSAYWYSGLYEDKAEWFISSYALMFISMRLSMFLNFFLLYTNLFLTVAISADRVFALWKPFVYKNINHAHHTAVATSLSVAIAFLISVDHCWYYEVVEVGNNVYTAQMNYAYLSMGIAKILEDIRTPLRLMTIAGLIALNILMVLGYQRRMKKLQLMSTTNQDKADARTEANKELLILTICQCCLTCLEEIPHAIMHILLHQSDYWGMCGLILSPVVHGAIIIADLAEFLVVISVNRKMRQNVIKLFSWRTWCVKRCGSGSTAVVPMRHGGDQQSSHL